MLQEAKDYYRSYSKNHENIFADTDLIGECYLGFSKLL